MIQNTSEKFTFAEQISARSLGIKIDETEEKTSPKSRQPLTTFSIPKQQFFSPRQVASLLLFSDQTVWRWIRCGKLPAIRVGRYYRIPLETLIKLLEDH